jgi:hypothetical protein
MERIFGEQIPNESKRCKLFKISSRELMTILRTRDQSDTHYTIFERITRPKAIPEGAKIWGVYNSWSSDCLIIVVEHESFDEVPMGQEFPYFDEMVRWERTGYHIFNDWVVNLNSMDIGTLTKLKELVNEKLYDLQQTGIK